MKTLFFGTPALAVPYLQLLAEHTELQAVVTTPDEPAGRGYELQPTPVKQTALKLKLPVLQPTNLKDPALLSQLEAFAADVIIVVAYGKLLPQVVLRIPRLGFINVHFSLLPAYRGAAPIQRALMAGETHTGVTLFWLDEGMDTGPIVLQKGIDIAEQDDAETLRQKLIPLGLKALEETLEHLMKGTPVRIPQAGPSSLAPILKKDEGQIDWNNPAATIVNLIRGTSPWPGAFTFVREGGKAHRLKVLKAQVLASFSGTGSDENGTVAGIDKGQGLVVKCSQEFLQILQVQPEGKRPMSAWDYWQGARLKVGVKLG
jgi:methionyl-tRNA formyltransferase